MSRITKNIQKLFLKNKDITNTKRLFLKVDILGNKNAFTLIELLVSIGIIVLLLAVGIPSFNRYGRYNELYQMAQTLKSDIITAKNYSLAPPKDKTKNIENYVIRFYNNNSGFYYNIFEEGKDPNTSSLVSSKTNSDYVLSIENPIAADFIDVKFSIKNAGKIVYPDSSTQPKILLRMHSNRITSSDNSIDISIDTATGEVNLIQNQ